jgi:hypothetical protein
MCCQTENNIVFVVDCYSRLRHCRWVSWLPAVLMKATRLLELDCSKRLRAIGTSCRCMVWSTMSQQESAIPHRLVDAALLGVRPKTSLSLDAAHGVGSDVFDGWHFFRPAQILILER